MKAAKLALGLWLIVLLGSLAVGAARVVYRDDVASIDCGAPLKILRDVGKTCAAESYEPRRSIAITGLWLAAAILVAGSVLWARARKSVRSE